MVYELPLTDHEIIDIFDRKCISASTIGYTIPPETYEISNFLLKLKKVFTSR